MNELSAGLSDDIPELTEKEWESAIPSRARKRLMQGRFESGEDIAALRRFVRLTQEQFAQALGISIHTLRNWEQGRRTPEGPALALLRIAAKHPRIIRENIESAA
jgi:putative transcriptional regulator